MRCLSRFTRNLPLLHRLKARPELELLEDRLLLDGNGGIDPNILRTMDSYLDDWVGPDETTYLLRQASGPAALPTAFAAQLLPGVPARPLGPGGPEGPGSGTEGDPGALGPFEVTREEYDCGNLAYQPPAFPTAGSPQAVELIASVHAPTDLSDGPRPLIVLMHGRHNTTYNPTTGATSFVWPPNTGGGFVSIPSYQGYDYLSNVLASHGYIVVSVSANGINARDAGSSDSGMAARGNLVQRHLDLWADFNRDGETPFGQAPFGARFVGKVDLQNVGTMGHSRGGEGVVRNFIINQARPPETRYGIKAVFPLAPVDFQRPIINNVALGVLLPTHDGDVSDNQGVHFYDDARYNVAGDISPKHTFQVNGANHNFYNTVWTPGLFPPAGTPGSGATSDDGVNAGGAANRLPAAQVRGTGLATMAAFFRTYVGNSTVPVSTAFVPFLKGDVPAPPSAQVGDDKLRVSYHAPDTAAFRRDLNRLLSPNSSDLVTNTLGGAVIQSGLSPYDLCGGAAPQPATCLPGQAASRQPHTTGARPGLSQMRLGWTSSTEATWTNELPAGFRNVSGFYALQFRAGLNWNDTRNPANVPQDFSMILTDGMGRSASTLVSDSARSLFYPTGGGTPIPKLFLNTVRIPLNIFAAGNVDLTDVRSVRFNFDQNPNGALMITDLAFSDPATTYAGPYVMLSQPLAFTTDTIPGPLSGQVAGPIRSLRLYFNTPINVSTFDSSDIVSFNGPSGSIAVTGVVPVPGKFNRQFDILFTQQSTSGAYTLTLGSNILDAAGNRLDQNFNRVLGETTADRASVTFRLSGAASTAEIAVLDGAVNLIDGTAVVDFGATPTGTSVSKTFTVRNLATGALNASTLVLSPISVPAGFTVTTSFGTTLLMPNQATTFTIRLDAGMSGTISGQLSFGNNDSNENPFDFTIRGTVGDTLRVTEFTPTNTGFTLLFNRALNPASLNLYDTQTAGLGLADVTVVGATTGAVRGSLVMNSTNTRITFIATGPVLVNDTYTVTLRSAANGFVDTSGGLLDGNGDFTTGDDFSTTFTQNLPTSVIVTVPDLVRGPGQAVNLPVDASGFPLRLTNSADIFTVHVVLSYDPSLLNITAATLAPGMPASATVTLDTSAPGVAIVDYVSPESLVAGVTDFVRLTASVPLSAASSYTRKVLLDLSDVQVNGTAALTADDDGIQIIAYLGDATGNGTYSSSDAVRVARVAVGLDSGFSAYQLADPVLVGDVTGNNVLNSTDGNRILQAALTLPQSAIPAQPDPVPVVTPLGPDPYLNIPRSFRARRGGVVTVPVNIDFSEGFESAELALSYDTTRLELVAVRRGRLTRDFDLFSTKIDSEAGTIGVSLARSAGSINGRGSGSVVFLTFRIKADAPRGRAIINLRENLGMLRTGINEGNFDLIPNPSNTAGDELDGAIRVIAEDVARRLRR